jgi:hypothetical protein
MDAPTTPSETNLEKTSEEFFSPAAEFRGNDERFSVRKSGSKSSRASSKSAGDYFYDPETPTTSGLPSATSPKKTPLRMENTESGSSEKPKTEWIARAREDAAARLSRRGGRFASGPSKNDESGCDEIYPSANGEGSSEKQASETPRETGTALKKMKGVSFDAPERARKFFPPRDDEPGTKYTPSKAAQREIEALARSLRS